MYIIKNAYKNIVRSIGRNILIGIIITIITIASCITIAINKSGTILVNNYKKNNPLEVTLNLDTMNFRNANDEEKNSFELLNLDTINKIGKLKEVKGYYYTLINYLNSSQIEKISYDKLFDKPDNENIPNDEPRHERMKDSRGDFTLIAYSDISYNDDFINGNKKIIKGEMLDKNNNESKIVISEELATENDLSVGDKITFTNINDENITYDLEIIGIYKMGKNEGIGPNQPTSNQIISNLNVLNKIIQDNNDDSNFENSRNINAVYYISNNKLDKFTKDIKSAGVSEYYKINTNEEEIESSLKPIQNITTFSFTFLIIVLIVGCIVLTVINLFNIRERKYEIGVLRAIGMTKLMVTLQLVIEVFMISLISLIAGTIVGLLLSQPISNTMLKSEINSMNNEIEEVNENFGNKGDFRRPINRPNKKVEYVDSLKVNIDSITIIELFAISLFLTIISGSVAVMYVNKFEPNKILQNRN